MTKRVVVVVHGVGDSPPGASLLEVGAGLAAPGVRADLVIDGVVYPRMTLEHAHVAEVVEMNWSDVARPTTSALGVLDYLARIVVALLATAKQQTRGWSRRLAVAYRHCFEGLLVYCIYAPLLAMVWFVVEPASPTVVVAAGAAAALAVGALTLYLQRFGGTLWAGWLWVGAFLVSTAAVAAGRMSPEQAVWISSAVYVSSQVVTTTVLFFALVSLLLTQKSPLVRRIAGMGLLYFPFFIVSAIGAALWALALAGAALLTGARFDEWQDFYVRTLDSIGYDLALLEFTFASMVGLVALLLLAVALMYFARAKRPAKGEEMAGQLARNGGAAVIALGAVIFLALCVVYAVLAATEWRSEWSRSALEVYSYSALRFVPYLPLAVGPLAIVAGIVVDILFYIVPRRELSTAAALRRRLDTVLDHALATGRPVVVAAHSQGTVIAVDVVGRRPRTDRLTLVTAGSPVVSLYERFLGSTPESRAAANGAGFEEPSAWINFWREGDYIGAAQDRAVVQENNLGVGGHTRYWPERRVWSKSLSHEPAGADAPKS